MTRRLTPFFAVLLSLIGLSVVVPIHEVQAQPDPQDDFRFKELRKQLIDPNRQVSEEAARQLAEIADLLHNSVPFLVMALESRSPRVRAQAAKTLATIGPRADGAITALVRAIPKEKDDAALRRMIGALGAIAPGTKTRIYIDKALATIAPFTKHKEVVIRRQAVSSLGAFKQDAKIAVPTLLEALSDPDPGAPPGIVSVSIRAMLSLQDIGPDAKAAANALFKLLDSSDHDKKSYAMGTLVKIAPNDKRLAPALIKAMGEQNSLRIRFSAAGCLVVLESEAKAAVPELIKALKVYDLNNAHAAKMLRHNAVRALGAIGPAAKGALAEIRRVADSDPDRTVRREAEKVVGLFDSPNVNRYLTTQNL